MRYMTVEMDNKGNEFETEHKSPEAAIMDAMDKWRHLSDAQKRTDRDMPDGSWTFWCERCDRAIPYEEFMEGNP